MHNLRYMSFDATQALCVVGVAIAVIAGLHLFESWAARHVRERTQRALRALSDPKRDRDVT